MDTINNFAQMVFNNVPNKIALIDNNKSITYPELATRSRCFAQHLISNNIIPGSRIIIALNDSIEWVVSFFGCIYAGVIPVLIHHQTQDQTLKNIINSINASAIILDSNRKHFNDTISITPQDINNLDIFVNIQPYNFADTEEGIWLTSSGTTNNQKFIIHRHDALKHMHSYITGGIDIKSTDVLMATPRVSFNYVFCFLIVAGLMNRATLVFNKSLPKPTTLNQLIKTHQITHIFSTPSVLSMFIESDDKLPNLKQLSNIITAGEKTPPGLVKKVLEKFNIRIRTAYGMGEMFGPVCIEPVDNAVEELSLGVLFPNVESKICNDDGSICDTNEPGELYLRSQCTAIGYFNLPDKTNEVFNQGWFKTNDLVIKNFNNTLTHIARKDNMLKINGMYVNAEKIESIIAKHDAIKECLISTKINNHGLSELVAHVVLNRPLKIDELKTFIIPQLTSYEIPKEFQVLTKVKRTLTDKKVRNIRG